MSSLNSFKVIRKGPDFVDIKVTIIHPDEHLVQSSPNFALQILLELFEQIREGYIYNSNWSYYPLSQEEADLMIKNEYLETLDSLLLKMRGGKIDLSEENYNLISNSGNFEYQGQKLTSIGMKNGSFYGSLEAEYDEFCLEAENSIKAVEILSVSNYPHWFDSLECWLEYGKLSYGFDDEVYELHQEINDPEYLLRIHLSPDSLFLLNHVRETSFWESAAYDFLPYCKKFKKLKEAAHNCLLYDTIVPEIEDNQLQKWWNLLPETWKLVFNLNLFLQSREYYPSLHENFKGMMTPEVFSFHFGREKLEELSSHEPNLKEIRNMVSMKMLFASNCNLKDLSPLSALKNLKMLELEQNPIENADILKSLTELEDLTLIVNGKKPNQLGIAALSKMKDLTFDPQNQAELEVLANMPLLRTFYTELDFEPNLSVLLALKQLKKIVGTSPSIDQSSRQILSDLIKQGVEISWKTDSDSI